MAPWGIALAVPLANSLAGGWQASLSSWGYAALIPLVIWLPQLFKEPNVRSQKSLLGSIVGLMRNRRAWQVTAHMAWLPTVLQLRGMSESEAAAWPTAMQICGCLASLIIPTLASRVRNQSGWAAACGFTSAISIVGILWMPQAWVGLATIGLGLGLNAGFSLSLLLIAMRSNDAETAGNLSSMAQTFGYLVAAPFPWFIGWLSTATGSWTVAYVFLVIPALAVALAGALAGRAGFVR